MPLYGTTPSEFERVYLNQNEDAGFYRYLMNRGWGGNNPLSDYARRQQGNTYGQYSAMAAQNPNLGFFDYLEQNQPDFGDSYLQQTPSQRNDYGSVRFAPRTRYTRLS